MRALAADALADFERLAATRFFAEHVAAGRVVGTELVEERPDLEGPYVAALRHETVPFVSYPYEWSFGMLRDAALLQLDLLLAALSEDMTLKDASPYNVQWRGTTPVFVDVASFERLRPGEPWEGYRQFCMLFLYPLLLQAYRGVPFNGRLRGSVDGIPPQELRRLLAGRDLLRRGVLTHVVLHSRLERRYADRGRDVRGELREAGFGKALVEANARRLAKLVRRLRWEPDGGGWSRYGATTSYTEEDAERKTAFVGEEAARRRPKLLWDLGCNDGRYTGVAAEHAEYAVAIDADPVVVDALYEQLAAEGNERIHPLVVDLADPSPALGWRARERRPLWERGTPDLVLCLALVHHLALSRNVPPRELVEWLRSLGSALVIEFVTKDDPMAKRLLGAKREGLHADYERETFERLLRERFDVERTEELAGGTRILFASRPRE